MNNEIVIYDTLNTIDNSIGVSFKECTSIILREQLSNKKKGFENLTIEFPLSNPKSKHFKNEREIDIGTKSFTIKTITRTRGNTSTITIYAEAMWYGLNNGNPLPTGMVIEDTVFSVVGSILNRSGLSGIDRWSTDSSFSMFNNVRFVATENANCLYNLRYLAGLVGGEIYYHRELSGSRYVSITERVGEDTDQVVSYRSNLAGISRLDDSTNLVTRMYLYGKDNIDISSINGGLPYVENYTYYDQQNIPRKVKSKIVVDERFSVLENMRDYMRNYLEVYSVPFVSYELEQIYLDRILNIGDSITVLDEELEITARHRIFERTINFLNPELSTYVLDNAIGDLSDSFVNEDNYIDAPIPITRLL